MHPYLMIPRSPSALILTTGCYQGGAGTLANPFDPSFTKSGANLTINYGDGTVETGKSFSHNYAATPGNKTVIVTSPDGWSGVTAIDINTDGLQGSAFSLVKFANLGTLGFSTNQCAGALPDPSVNPKLTGYYLHVNAFTGSTPSFANNPLLLEIYIRNNALTGYGGGLAVLKSVSTISASANAFTAAAVNAILDDLVKSLALSGRVACNVNLSGGTNAAPTGDALTIYKPQLAATAGWVVTTT